MRVVAYGDLPRKISGTGGTLVKYSYLADGSKTSAENGSGEGLVYRGSLIYKKASGGTLTFDGASIPEGRLLSGATRLYVTDHLGSVKAVVNGNNGNLYEVNNYTVIWQTEREQQRQQLPEHSSHRREVPPALHRQGRPGPGLLRPVHGLRCATVQPGPPPLAGPRPPEREVLWHKPLCLLCGRSGEFGG